jgi:hypothetical protein
MMVSRTKFVSGSSVLLSLKWLVLFLTYFVFEVRLSQGPFMLVLEGTFYRLCKGVHWQLWLPIGQDPGRIDDNT